MFDFHMHSKVSFDSEMEPKDMVARAKELWLKEICFTDHIDYEPGRKRGEMVFSRKDYEAAYRDLDGQGVKLNFGMEFGLMPDNREDLEYERSLAEYDFVIGSVHFAEGVDIYHPPFWQGRTVLESYEAYLREMLDCVRVHDGFHVLGHLTYPTKAHANPTHQVFRLEDHQEIVDAIFKVLIAKGKGLEVNTSGIETSGHTLPPFPFVKRFLELGGEILTVGSDAHRLPRVGINCHETIKALGEFTQYVCTFREGKPVFHKIP